VWVANTDDDSVSVVDCATDSVVTTVPVGSQPAGITIDPQVGVFVANAGDGTVTVLGFDNTPSATVEIKGPSPLRSRPVGLANLHDAGMVIAFNRDGGVARLEHGQLTGTSFMDGGEGFPADNGPRSPHGVAAAAGLNPYLYASSPGVNEVSVFDTSAGFPRRRARIRVGQRPVGVAAHPRQPLVYVVNSGSDTVSVIRGEEVIATIDVAARPLAAAAGADGRVWITHDAGTVSMIGVPSATDAAPLEVGSRPEGIIADQRGRGYVAISGENTVVAIDPEHGTS
jgi:YVTN family beta-propeller protein